MSLKIKSLSFTMEVTVIRIEIERPLTLSSHPAPRRAMPVDVARRRPSPLSGSVKVRDLERPWGTFQTAEGPQTFTSDSSGPREAVLEKWHLGPASFPRVGRVGRKNASWGCKMPRGGGGPSRGVNDPEFRGLPPGVVGSGENKNWAPGWSPTPPTAPGVVFRLSGHPGAA